MREWDKDNRISYIAMVVVGCITLCLIAFAMATQRGVI